MVPAFQKGFCFAHVGYQIYNGYLSREAYQSVLKMKVLGANSFSITPFTSMRNASEPEPLRFWEFPGAENDESVIFLAHTACDLNMYAMLKPHIYLGRSGWPGDIKMSDPDDWKLFFKDYYDWISHYAMIAEMYRIPILCIGNELAAATVGHEKEWIDMVKKIRSFYDGKITYGPNWSGEFEKLTFWKYFDFIGLSEYYPLSEKENPTDSDLKNGAEDIMKRIGAVSEKYNKKIIFTEVGFRDSGRPWKTASEGSGRDSVNYRNQARCYEALFEAAHNKSWLAGMYWWKWPSYLSYGSETSRALYTPDNRPAERVVNKWYHRIK